MPDTAKDRESCMEQTPLDMFNRAAADLTLEDLEERESLLGGFAGRELTEEQRR